MVETIMDSQKQNIFLLSIRYQKWHISDKLGKKYVEKFCFIAEKDLVLQIILILITY